MTVEKTKLLVEKFGADISEEQSNELEKSLGNVPEESYERISNVKTKSVKTTVILSSLLGLFGAGSFYLGLIKRGVVKVVCNVLVPLILCSVFLIWLSPMHLKYSAQAYAVSDYELEYGTSQLDSAVKAYDSSNDSNNKSAYREYLNLIESIYKASNSNSATLAAGAEVLENYSKYSDSFVAKTTSFRTAANLQTLSQNFSDLATCLADVKEGETITSAGLASAELKAAVTAAKADVNADTQALLDDFLKKLNKLSNVSEYKTLGGWNDGVQAVEGADLATLKTSLSANSASMKTFAEGCADGQYYLDNYASFSAAMTQVSQTYEGYNEYSQSLVLLRVTVSGEGANEQITLTAAPTVDTVLADMKKVFTVSNEDKTAGVKTLSEVLTAIDTAISGITDKDTVTDLKAKLSAFSSKLTSDAPETKIDSCISGLTTAKTELKKLNNTELDADGVKATVSSLIEKLGTVVEPSVTATKNAATSATAAKTHVDALLDQRDGVAPLATTYEGYLKNNKPDKAVEDKTGFTAKLTESKESLEKVKTSTNFEEIKTALNKALSNVRSLTSNAADGYFNWLVSGKWEKYFVMMILIIDGITIVGYWIDEVFKERKKCKDYNYKLIQNEIA